MGRLGGLPNSRGQRTEYILRLRVDWWECPRVGSAGPDEGIRPWPSGPPHLRPSWKRRMQDTALFGAEVSATRDLRWAQLLLALSVVLIAAASVQLLDGVFAHLAVK